jgi:hypothetical protein
MGEEDTWAACDEVREDEGSMAEVPPCVVVGGGSVVEEGT